MSNTKKFKRSRVVKFPQQTNNTNNAGGMVHKLNFGSNPSIEPMNPNEITDPQVTINLKNPEIKEALTAYKANKSAENLEKVVQTIMKCRVLLPTRGEKNSMPQIILLKGTNPQLPDKELFFLPVFTEKAEFSDENVRKINTQSIMNTLYLNANHFALKDEKITGLTINPFTDNIVLSRQLLKAVEEAVEKKTQVHIKAETPAQPKPLKVEDMTDEQYFDYEYARFTLKNFPEKFFAEKSSLVKELCSRKEEYFDEIFEASYQNNRMYPYLPEEMYILPMGLAPGEDIIQIDMPHADKHRAMPQTLYLYANDNTGSYRYFILSRLVNIQTKSITNEIHLAEIGPDLKLKDYGEAAAEGNQIRTILDMCRDKKEEE